MLNNTYLSHVLINKYSVNYNSYYVVGFYEVVR